MCHSTSWIRRCCESAEDGIVHLYKVGLAGDGESSIEREAAREERRGERDGRDMNDAMLCRQRRASNTATATVPPLLC